MTTVAKAHEPADAKDITLTDGSFIVVSAVAGNRAELTLHKHGKYVVTCLTRNAAKALIEALTWAIS